MIYGFYPVAGPNSRDERSALGLRLDRWKSEGTAVFVDRAETSAQQDGAVTIKPRKEGWRDLEQTRKGRLSSSSEMVWRQPGYADEA